MHMDDKEAMVNIFFTDSNPVIAARDSCDSYVVKYRSRSPLSLFYGSTVHDKFVAVAASF